MAEICFMLDLKILENEQNGKNKELVNVSKQTGRSK
jgi:hypothetical protein